MSAGPHIGARQLERIGPYRITRGFVAMLRGPDGNQEAAALEAKAR